MWARMSALVVASTSSMSASFWSTSPSAPRRWRPWSTLRPGGWLVVEDVDPALQPLICPDEVGPEQRLADQLRRGFRTLMAGWGADLAYGRTPPRLLRDAGLVDVEADAYFSITSPACTLLEQATVEQIRGRLVSNGIATDADIDLHLANIGSGCVGLATSPMVSSWGRKPPVD